MNEKIFDEVERLRFYDPDLYVWFEERAAIMQFDGGLSREEAEREALHLARAKKASERTLRREAWKKPCWKKPTTARTLEVCDWRISNYTKRICRSHSPVTFRLEQHSFRQNSVTSNNGFSYWIRARNQRQLVAKWNVAKGCWRLQRERKNAILRVLPDAQTKHQGFLSWFQSM